MPITSVILTSFNHGNFIREAIDSILNQTFQDFELIIWDDASTDNSWEIIQSYSDPRIRAVQNSQNKGPVFGVNKAISEITQSKYIAIHHSDDIWEPGKLQIQVDFLDSNPNIGAVFTNAQPIDERGAPLADSTHFYYNIFSQPNRSRHAWLRHFFFRGNALCHPSVLIRKNCYADCGAYLDFLAQLPDFNMWIRLCAKYEIHVLADRLIKFRVHDSELNTSGNRPDVRIRDRSEFHFTLKNFFQISTFDELLSIFPEAEKYFSPNGCVPKFVLSMVALSENTLLWAKFLGIETLFELLADASASQKIKALYQFDYRDFIALTAKYDLFSLETVANLNLALAERDVTIERQTEKIARLSQSAQTISSTQTDREIPSLPSSQARLERYANDGNASISATPSDRVAYEKAARLLESGQNNEGVTLLEGLAKNGNSCWEVYNDLAVLFFNRGDNSRAAPYFQKGIALEGKSGSTARNFATMLAMTGDIEGALAILGGILHEQPHDIDALTVIRDILSDIKPIPLDAWLKLVSDLRCEPS